MYKVGNIVKQIQRKQKIFLNLFFKSCILTNGRSLGPGEEIILFFMPKILTSGSLKYLEIPLVVLYSTVLYKTTLRVFCCVIGTRLRSFECLCFESYPAKRKSVP